MLRRRRQSSGRALAVALLLTVVATLAPPGPAGAQAPPPVDAIDDAQLARKLDADGAGDAQRAKHAGTGGLRFLGASPGRPIRRQPGVAPNDPPEKAARAFLAAYGPQFGIADQARDLALLRAPTDHGGRTSARFRQVHKGVPVLAGELVVLLDGANNVLTTTGEALPDLDVDVRPGIGAARAAVEAREAVAKARGVPLGSLTASPAELWIYDPRLLGAPGVDVARLVWRTDVTGHAPEHLDELVLVDADRGGVALHFDQLAHAKDRFVCNRNNVRDPDADGTPCVAPYARTEGGGPTGVVDVDEAYDHLGATYDFYATRFGRDSIDGAGLALRATVKYCPKGASVACPYANAFWDSPLRQIYLGQGETDDDTVAHELTHGVTDSESNLFYFMQSGAINESLSDVFGELVDLTDGLGNDSAAVRWKLFEDAGSGILRDMRNPPVFNDPDRMQSSLYFTTLTSDSGGVHTNSGVNNKAAYLMTDGDTFNGRTVTGLGVDKVARIYYDVQTQLLTSGSDYADLYNLLPQACTNLTGVLGITAADCAEVRDAVDATEMNLEPPGAAAVPEAPVCAAGESPAFRIQDDLEQAHTSPDWSRTHTAGTEDWEVDTFYATSGVRHFWGWGASVPSDYTVARASPIVVEGGKATYLRFRHAYDFENGYDGGIVEYTTDGSTWTDAGPLFSDNGYGSTVRSDAGTVLTGRPAFTGIKGGYLSSRVNLSALAGQSVRFRFRVVTDISVSARGWFVDDVWLYTCEAPTSATSGRYTPLTPARILDTRDGTGGLPGAIGPGATAEVQVTNRGGVPAGGVTAVAMNVTVTQPTAAGFLTLYPNGTARPLAANLNFVPNQTVPNLVVVKVGADGRVALYNSSGASHVVFDVAGWYSAVPAGNDGRYQPLVPARILDTRNGTGGGVRLEPGASLDVQVAGAGGVPASGVGAAVLNVAVTSTTGISFLTVYPTGQARPNAANLNFLAGDTASNRVMAKLGAGGRLTVYNHAASTDVVVDVNGWYTDASLGGTTGAYEPLVPARILDTRDGTGGIFGPRAAGSTVDVQVAGQGGVPASGVGAVILNATVTQPPGGGYLTIFPGGAGRPLASDLNFAPGETRPNLVVVKLGAGGTVSLYTSAGGHVVFDVAGWFAA